MKKYRGKIEGTDHVAYDESFEMIWFEEMPDETFYMLSTVYSGGITDGDVVEVEWEPRSDGRFDSEGEYKEVISLRVVKKGLVYADDDDDDLNLDGLSEEELVALGEKFLPKGSFKKLPK